MHIIKCDICKKEIDEVAIYAGVSMWGKGSAQLCKECGAPVLEFLVKNKIVKGKNKIKEN